MLVEYTADIFFDLLGLSGRGIGVSVEPYITSALRSEFREPEVSDQFASFCAIKAAHCDIKGTVVFLLPLFLFVCEQRGLFLDDNVSFALGDMVEISGEVLCSRVSR